MQQEQRILNSELHTMLMSNSQQNIHSDQFFTIVQSALDMV